MNRAVVPGEKLGMSEEYIAREGTYEKEGVIYAEKAGALEVHEGEMTVRVDTGGPLPGPPRTGDLVIGMVATIRSSMALVEVLHCINNPRTIITEDYATLHISNLDSSYHRDFSDGVAPGDIIKAVVVQDEPAVKLKTSSPDLGVITSTCMFCGQRMERRGKGFYCGVCEKEFLRKTARIDTDR